MSVRSCHIQAMEADSLILVTDTLIKLLLTLCSTTLALLTAMAGYLFAIHALGAPTHAPLTALLCAFVPFLAFRAGAGVLGDA